MRNWKILSQMSSKIQSSKVGEGKIPKSHREVEIIYCLSLCYEIEVR